MKTLFMSFFVFLSIIATGFSYQTWQTNQQEPQLTQINTFHQVQISQTLSQPEGKRLVPLGAFMGTNDVNYIYYEYVVDVEPGAPLNLSVGDILLTNDQGSYRDEYNLLNVDFDTDMISDTQVKVYVTVSLNMPEDEYQYNLLSGSEVSFKIYFD